MSGFIFNYGINALEIGFIHVCSGYTVIITVLIGAYSSRPGRLVWHSVHTLVSMSRDLFELAKMGDRQKYKQNKKQNIKT